MITVFANNKEVPVNMVEFSDGAITFKLDELPSNPRYISINVCTTTPVHRVREEITLVHDCILNTYMTDKPNIELNIPYLPYGRADRIFEKGNPNALNCFLDFLENELAWVDVINVCDVHNESSIQHYNIKNKSQLECFKQSLSHDFNTEYDIVLAADKGAVDKAQTIAAHLEVDVLNCGKERDISTGKIIKSTLPDVDFKGKKVLIPDDLMDGGYTFIKLAEQLREVGASQVDLYVTHLIASKGLDIFKGLIDNVYCYQTVGKYVNKLDVTHFNLNK